MKIYKISIERGEGGVSKSASAKFSIFPKRKGKGRDGYGVEGGDYYRGETEALEVSRRGARSVFTRR